VASVKYTRNVKIEYRNSKISSKCKELENIYIKNTEAVTV